MRLLNFLELVGLSEEISPFTFWFADNHPDEYDSFLSNAPLDETDKHYVQRVYPEIWNEYLKFESEG